MNDIVTPIKIRELERLLIATDYDRQKTLELIHSFSEGFDLGYRGPVNRKNVANNLPLNIGSHAEIWEKMMKEVHANRYAGPYDKIPFQDHYIQSLIGLVPKDNGTKTRLIFHLSYDFKLDNGEILKSVNYFTPEHLCKGKYKDLDYAIKTSLNLIKQIDEGLWNHLLDPQTLNSNKFELSYSKTDVVSTFRILPMFPAHQAWLVMKAINPNTGKFVYFVDKCLPFGASISCTHFQSFSDTLAHIGEVTMQVNLSLPKQIPITNYLDDFLFIAVMRYLCDLMMKNFIWVCQEIGCPISAEKTQWAEGRIVFLGMLLYGRYLTISVPEDKVQKAIQHLNQLITQRKVTIKLVQQVAGLLNFLNKAIVPGRAFTRRLYDKN